MKDTEKIDGLRNEYLAAMAELSGLAVDRASHLPGDIIEIDPLSYLRYRNSSPPAGFRSIKQERGSVGFVPYLSMGFIHVAIRS